MTELQKTRLEYVHRRKEFLNQKTFYLFEKLQIAVFGFVSYVLVLVAMFHDGDLSQASLLSLTFIADIFLALFLVIYLLLSVINIRTWREYDLEEGRLLNLQSDISPKDIFKWFETWLLIIAVLEVILFVVLAHVSISAIF
ncbi:hypothetical protein [Tateyamaria sp. SN3-11]|uniref:hypothetical protein n=1 Tax=Tateyamaria sp. SN3-11 TaxID=3092147 RepID=UPI0039E969DC